MRKYIITLIIMFLVLPTLVSARGEPPVFIGYKVKVNNTNGIVMKTNDNKEITIPNDTILDINYEYEIEGKLYGSVEYDNSTGMVEMRISGSLF